MTVQSIRDFYDFYRSKQKAVQEIEDSLLTASSKDEWFERLTAKSTLIRSSYKEVASQINIYIYPYLNHEVELDDELAKAFLDEAIDMSVNIENDPLITTEIFKLLSEYYEKRKLTDEQILATFFTGISYADMTNPACTSIAYNYFDKIYSLSAYYFECNDWNVRRRIVYAIYNRVINNDFASTHNTAELLNNWKDAFEFFNDPRVLEIDGGRYDFTELCAECRNSVIWHLATNDLYCSQDELQYVADNFLPQNARIDNLQDYSPAEAMLFMWYKHVVGLITKEELVTLLSSYYKFADKTINYDVLDFYEAPEYQTQICYMQEFFRHYAKIDNPSLELISLYNDMLSDFKHLYECVPLRENNAFINADLCEILKHVLTVIPDEATAFSYLNEVVIRRNVMTQLHSTMVANISTLIVKSVVKSHPDLFDGFDVNDTDALVQYISYASYIHDIGKIDMSDIINQQLRRITDFEFYIIKHHPAWGLKKIKNSILADKYSSVVLGHHRFYDNTAGYPLEYDTSSSNNQIIVDIVTIADCIDAATDTLGRNYTTGKKWNPTVMGELATDGNHHYNEKLVSAILGDTALVDAIEELTTVGRKDIYYGIYSTYFESV